MTDVSKNYNAGGASHAADFATGLAHLDQLMKSREVATDTTHFPFSPESLLYYCSSRLGAIDEQIDRYFKDQQAKNRASKELADVQSVMGQASWQMAGTDAAFGSDQLIIHKDAGNQLLEIYRKAETPEGKAAAAEAFKIRTGRSIDEFANGGSVQVSHVFLSKANIAGMDGSQWGQVIEGIKSKSSALSKSAEMNMIQLQSLVSQRQLAIQLTTQLMQSVHESLKGIAANFRG